MNFVYNMPSEIIFGKDCVLKNAEKFKEYKTAMLVTGKRSAKASGALDEIINMMRKIGVEYFIFDQITENPLISVCYGGGQAARTCGADLIVGIGGGSPLDAAKAIALFAANPQITRENMNDIFTPPYENEPLPVIAVPTTAGTGSEANPYSILTLDGKDLKKTFNYSKSYPKVSFADPKYTESLPYNITVSTAIDAFCHCIESYLSVKSTPFSAIYAECGMKHIFKHLEAFADSPESSAEIEYETREDLMLGALCGGVAINTTGTCFPHPMGYNLTLINGLPHGKACGVFTGEFLRIHEKAAENDYKLRSILNSLYSACGSSFEKICAVIETLTDYHEKFDNDTLLSYVEKIKDAKNFSNSYVKIPEKKILKIYQNCIGEKT